MTSRIDPYPFGHLLARRLLPVLFVVALPACDGSGGTGVPLRDLPTALDHANCEWMVGCGFWPDMDACMATIFGTRDANLKTLQAAAEAGLLTYDGDAAEACLDRIAGTGCGYSGWTVDSQGTCRGVFVGTVADGGACVDDEQCASEECDTAGCSMACCTGTCVPAPAPIAIGGDCSAPDAECVTGAYCAFNSFGESVCAPTVPEGGACDDSSACDPGLACHDDPVVGSTCGARPAEGEVCDPAGFVPCDRLDNYCDPTAMTCQRRKDAGEACVLLGGGDSSCALYALCVGGACVTKAVEGEPCAGDRNCLGLLQCNGGVCTAPPDEPACPVT